MAGRPAKLIPPTIGKNIAFYRNKRGLTQAKFAALMDISIERVNYYERRAKNPAINIVVKAAKILNVPVEKLLAPERKKSHKR
jgi:transcriptional regulator with XRE-family HTH domain